MYQNEYIISTDLKRKMTSIVPQFVQFDKAVLLFKIYDNGTEFDLTGVNNIEVTNLRCDGKAVVGLGKIVTLSDNSKVIRYDYLGSEMTVVGVNKVGLSMFKGEDKVSILPFDVHIVQDPREIAAGDTAKEDVGLLTQLIEAAQENLPKLEGLEHKGLYNENTEYALNNMVVSKDGSTYISLVANNKGNPLTDSSKWQLTARKGTDGKGALNSINGAIPDANGNLMMKASDIGAVSTAHLTDPEPHTYGNYTIKFNPARNSLDFVKVK